MMIEKLVNPHILDLQPYKPGKPMAELERELGITSSIKLASNENPIGPSPRAVAALHRAIDAVPCHGQPVRCRPLAGHQQ